MTARRSSWNLPGLFLSHAIAGVLILSYLWPATHAVWNSLDLHVAVGLNSMVRHDHAQQMIWSFANIRLFDYISAAMLLAVVVSYAVGGTNAAPPVRIARMIVTCILLISLMTFMRQFLFHDMAKDSPSLVLKPFTLLSEQTPFDAKDHSGHSFPGDHATVLASFVLLLWYFAGRGYGWVSTALAGLLVLPRLVSGAHWLSDVVIGGLVIALVVVPLVIFTPVEQYLVAGLLRLHQCLEHRDW